MPDLQNSYIYKDWIMDLNSYIIYHQCVKGTIHRTFSQRLETRCGACKVELPDSIFNHLRAVCKTLYLT